MKQKTAFDKTLENGGNVTKAMREAKYSETTINNPTNLTESDGWKTLVEEIMPDTDLVAVHKGLLNSSRIDHMVFPIGPKGEDDDNMSGAKLDKDTTPEEDENLKAERTTLTDKEIIDMLEEVNCQVRRIVHGNTARHVYFWANDNMVRDKALDKAYKLKGKYPSPIIAIQVNIGGVKKKYE